MPARSRAATAAAAAAAAIEDSRSEASSGKGHSGHGRNPTPAHHKGRKPNASHRPAVTTVSALKDFVSRSAAAAAAAAMHPVNGASGLNASLPSIPWATLPNTVLHSYRHAYHLPLPCAFTSSKNARTLTLSRIGRASPTMAVQKNRRRVSKEDLAKMVRKHFNSMGVNEMEAISRLMYVAEAERDRRSGCRMRFAP